jgi:thiol:disulfide interchange protein DsbC
MKALCLCLLAALSATAVAADEPARAPADPRAAIAKKFSGTKPEDIKPSPISGIYEVPMGADVLYVSADARYVFAGDLFELDSRVNLTEAGRSAGRGKALAKQDQRDMIVFAPASEPRHSITVFTDVECGYCRKLHSEIDQLNKLGIEVRYMAYPRAGPGTNDWQKMEAVWCAKDRKAAITQAKLGQEIKSPGCTAPVTRQYKLGEDLGVRGTPAIFTSSGDYIGGYLPPVQLAEQLNQLKNAAAKRK